MFHQHVSIKLSAVSFTVQARMPMIPRSTASEKINTNGDDHSGAQNHTVLVRMLTDLFVVRKHHTKDEIHQFAEIARRLLPDADRQTRLDVAAKLAPHPNAPRSILGQLLDSDEECAAIILQHAPELPEEAFIAAAQFGATDLAIAVATREDVSAELAAILMTREENDVWKALAQNRSAELSADMMRQIALRGRTDEALAAAICARSNDPTILQSLFLNASAGQRAAILLDAERTELLSPAPIQPIDPVECGQLELLALSHDAAEFRSRLATVLHCDDDMAQRVINDPRGEPLAIALSSLGMSADAIVRVFLTGDPIIAHSCERIEMLHRLVSQMSLGAAQRMMRAMLGVPLAPTRGPRGHQPIFDQIAVATASRPTGVRTTERKSTAAPLFLFRNRLR